MITWMDIMAAVEGLLAKAFPGEPVYRNLVPVDSARPSFLLEIGPIEMDAACGGLVECEVKAAITGFVAVDDYHNSQVEVLMDRLGIVFGLLSDGYLKVGDRALHITALKGDYQFDFFEVEATMTYTDAREPGAQEPLMSAVTIRYEEA